MKNKILVWGTGAMLANLLGANKAGILPDDVFAYIDNDPQKREKMFLGKKVFEPREVLNIEYDAIIVATIYSTEVEEQCIELGIDRSKIIYFGNPIKKRNEDTLFMKKILGDHNANVLNRKAKNVVQSSDTMDNVRYNTLKLINKEIADLDLKGAVAEVGVFRGNFSASINTCFPDKTLYLFDTFEGFRSEEAEQERKNDNCTEKFIEIFKDTSVDKVLGKMPYVEKIIVKKGLFPESLQGLEETFSFVSIDVDFKQSIYDCLDYFYPRLESGGYIFVHDYNSSLLYRDKELIMYLAGVRQAVKLYEEMHHLKLCKVPIPDQGGTLIITK